MPPIRVSLPRTFLLGCALVSPALPGAPAAAPAGPPAAAVLALMERAADWQLAHPSKHPETDWTQGAGDTGILALAELSPSPRFLQAMVAVGERNAWQPGPRPYHADDYCVGQAYTELYLRLKQPAMIAPLRARIDWILAHPNGENLDFDATRNPDHDTRWSWCDALFMAPPAWIRLFAATGEKAYLEYAVEHWWKTSDYLYDPAEHLYFRDSTYFSRREANGRKVFWSRGNGWVLAGLVRMLQFLPETHPSRARFLQQYREMADAILVCQQPDGLWRSSLLDPANYPLQETSGSGFYCYALAWGVNHGLLDRARFAPAVLRAWDGLAACVNADGKLTHVQPIGADPKHFDPDATEVYGVGAFLLAGSEVYRMVGGGR